MHGPGECSGAQQTVPLVLLPGSLCDERIFASLIARLPHVTTQVIVAPHADSIEEAARHVLSLAPSRFALLGFSLGGMVAMQIAVHLPSRVCGLALVSTSPLPVPTDQHAARREAAALAATVPMNTFVREQLWPGYFGSAKPGDGHDERLILMQSMASGLGPTVYQRQTEMAIQRPDYRPLLAAVRCPAVIVAGQQDVLCPPAAQYALHQAMPHSTLCMIGSAGHLALVERPAEVARAVAAWFHTVLQEQQGDPANDAPAQESK